MDEFDKLACDGDDSDVVVPFSLYSGVESTHRSGRASKQFGGLD